MMSVRRSGRCESSITSFAVKSFNHRSDSYRNGNAEGDRVDPLGLRGHRDRDGLFPFLAPDLSWRAPGGIPDSRDRDWEAAAVLRCLPPREAGRLPDRRFV